MSDNMNPELTLSQEKTIPIEAHERSILQTPSKAEIYEELNRICSLCVHFKEDGDSGVGLCESQDPPENTKWDSGCEDFNERFDSTDERE